MARRPAYLAELLKGGETATYNRDTGCWYAVKKTSHRIVGSKYPVVSHKITAALTASGRVEPSSRIKPDIESFEVREVGYSFVLRNLIPVKWKKALKSDQDEIFLWLISAESPTSFLLKDRELKELEHRNVNSQISKLWAYFPENLSEILRPLKTLVALYYPDRIVLQQPTEEQVRLMAQYNCNVEDIQL